MKKPYARPDHQTLGEGYKNRPLPRGEGCRRFHQPERDGGGVRWEKLEAENEATVRHTALFLPRFGRIDFDLTDWNATVRGARH
jgi:hypothetical protein